jgi:hypothetical protein
MRSKVLLISMGKGKALKLRKQFGFYAWNVQCALDHELILTSSQGNTIKKSLYSRHIFQPRIVNS